MMVDFKKLTADLRRDEGEKKMRGRHVAYKDSLGFLTIGIGRLIDERKGGGLTDDEADYLLNNDIQRTYAEVVSNLPWFVNLSEVRQRAIMNMAFQLGVPKLLGFRNTLALLRSGRYDEAAREALNSTWAGQTPARAKRVADMLRGG